VAITGSNSLDAAIAAAQQFPIAKATLVTKGAGLMQSLWKAAGFPIAGASPPTGAGGIPDRTTAGALSFASFGALVGYLAKFSLVSATAGTILIGDRLWACSGLNGTIFSPTSQPINGATITRNTSGIGNQLWIEYYTATGATASNLTVTYTNQAGVTGRTATIAMQVTPVAGQMIWVPLQAGDTGILSVQSAILSASTATAGDFGLTIINPIDLISSPSANLAQPRGVYDTAMPIIDPNAALMLYVLPSTTSTGQIMGNIALAQG
jgi:hypothetical protein